MAQTPLVPIGGSLAWAVGQELTVAIFGTAQTVTELFPTVITPPSSAPLTVELRAAAGTLSATIPIGEKSPAAPASGSLDVAAGEALRQVITADGNARDFSGWCERQSQGIAPATVGFTTLSEVKRERGISDTSQDAMIQDWILRVTKRMQRYMSRDILETTYTNERHDGGSPYLTPWQYPIVAIGAVTHYGTAIDPSELRISTLGTEIEHVIGNGVLSSFPRGAQSIEVSYTAGYAAIPEDLVLACTQQVGYEWMRTQPSNRNTSGVASKTDASGGTIEYQARAWLPEVLDVLNQRRRMLV